MADEVIDISTRLLSDEAVDSASTLTPSRSTTTTVQNVITTDYSAPIPGNTYRIVSVTCGRQIMILQGQLVLAEPDELGASYWACEQHDTWLAFRNTATGKVLGHDSGNPGLIRCDVQNNQQWEQMLAIPHTRTRGAFSLLTEYWYGRRAIGLYEEDEEGETRLCRIKDVHDPGVAWTFQEV